MGFFEKLPIPYLGYLFNWFGTILSSLGFSYVFYLLVERPSHNLARKITAAGAARRVTTEQPVPQTETASVP